MSEQLYLDFGFDDPVEQTNVQKLVSQSSTRKTSKKKPAQVSVQEPEQVSTLKSQSKPKQASAPKQQKLYVESHTIQRLVAAVGKCKMTVKEMMNAIGLRHRPNFLEYTLHPSIKKGYLSMRYPDSPRHPHQQYLLTPKGKRLFRKISNENQA